MTIVRSRVKTGVLTLTPAGGTAVDFSCQPTNVTISTEYEEEGEMLEVLCGDIDPPETTSARTLKITQVQDFDNAEGLQNFLLDNENTVIDYSWTPNSDGGPTYSGTCQARIGDIGGDVAAQITSDIEMPIVTFERTYPTPEAAPVASAKTGGTDGS